ncbi:MAG: benzoate/H(+) symporter BenE family transporter [Burkholderiaceae bacterium]
MRFSPSHPVAGLLAVMIGYTSSVAIVLQAADAVGASAAQRASWLLALGVGMAATCVGLSLRYRAPVLTAWSTPGAALLATSLQGVPMGDAIGAFVFSSALLALVGTLGWVDRLMRHVPPALASAMLAGVLFRFGVDLFTSMQQQAVLVGAMSVTYLAGRRLWPRYVIPATLCVGIAAAFGLGLVRTDALRLALAAPVFTVPSFSLPVLVGVGLPLFVVTMASQNVPGLAVLRANGYDTPVSPLIAWTGVTGLVLAPFGGFAFNLAAITAAICMSRDADPDPSRRYLAAVWAGGVYLVAGLFGASVVALFAAVPAELVRAIAGLALLGTLAASLASASADAARRDPAVVTFLVTVSGVSFLGVGSAFWGLVFGLVMHRAIGSD